MLEPWEVVLIHLVAGALLLMSAWTRYDIVVFLCIDFLFFPSSLTPSLASPLINGYAVVGLCTSRWHMPVYMFFFFPFSFCPSSSYFYFIPWLCRTTGVFCEYITLPDSMERHQCQSSWLLPTRALCLSVHTHARLWLYYPSAWTYICTLFMLLRN